MYLLCVLVCISESQGEKQNLIKPMIAINGLSSRTLSVHGRISPFSIGCDSDIYAAMHPAIYIISNLNRILKQKISNTSLHQGERSKECIRRFMLPKLELMLASVPYHTSLCRDIWKIFKSSLYLHLRKQNKEKKISGRRKRMIRGGAAHSWAGWLVLTKASRPGINENCNTDCFDSHNNGPEVLI